MAATDPATVTSANIFIFLFRNFPLVATTPECSRQLFLVWIRTVFRCTGSARTHEYFVAVQEGDIAAIRLAGRTAARVLGAVAADNDDFAHFQRIAREALAQQRIGCACLDHPLLRDAVG